MTVSLLLLHEGLPLAPHDAWGAWSREPGVLLLLLGWGVLYARGAVALRGASRGGAARRRRALTFWAGWVLLAAALVSPLHAMGGALLWAHMVQHELLMVAAAPLLVLGRPLAVALRGLPRAGRRRAGRWVRTLRPLTRRLGGVETAWALHALAIVAWHVPALYDRSATSELVHSLQHASFLGTALLFWHAVLIHARLRGRQGAAILSLFTTAIYTGGLGALLTVAPEPWYHAYRDGPPLWGLTPLEDQQLAGLIMWVPAGMSYLAATLWLVATWLRQSEARVARLEPVRPR
jgi:cytochrome c oxidase assembly factor CtaG